MTRDELREAVKQATKIVESWPLWKQNILKHSGEPSVSVPRTPVDNSQPNALTVRTIVKAESGIGVVRCEDSADLFRKLEI